jgi:hypothetical protein
VISCPDITHEGDRGGSKLPWFERGGNGPSPFDTEFSEAQGRRGWRGRGHSRQAGTLVLTSFPPSLPPFFPPLFSLSRPTRRS